MSSIAVESRRDEAVRLVAPRVRRRRSLRLRAHTVLRWLHVYTSMVSLLVVLFFAATGVTLNHPDWLATERTEEASGTLPTSWKTAKGIDWLVVAEHLRTANGVHGTVADRREDDREGSLTFRAPGYSAGLDFEEEAAVMRALGARDAVNLDGGGSTTMTIRGTVVTRPSDATGERPIGDAILLLPPPTG